MLREKFAAIESQMRGKLDEIRATLEHPGGKGTSIEEVFRKFMREFLPRRLDVGHGEILDSEDRRSKQTDLIVVNEDHPLTFTHVQPGLFFIEGVCAAGEVKTVLNSSGLDKAIENSLQFKQLEVDLGIGTLIHTNPSDRERFYKSPPWFLFAFTSELTLSTIKNKIELTVESEGIENNKFLDAVFILDRGGLINFGDGEGVYYLESPEGTISTGFVPLDSNSVLFDLMTWLSCVMPRMVRFEPIMPLYLMPKEQRS